MLLKSLVLAIIFSAPTYTYAAAQKQAEQQPKKLFVGAQKNLQKLLVLIKQNPGDLDAYGRQNLMSIITANHPTVRTNKTPAQLTQLTNVELTEHALELTTIRVQVSNNATPLD